jgi:RimJ/RimL family protein N-acetyltransferase
MHSWAESLLEKNGLCTCNFEKRHAEDFMAVNSSFFAVQGATVRDPEFESWTQDNEGFQIQKLTRVHREALLGMYRGFKPLGLALGLPPRTEESRVDWIDRTLEQHINLGTFASAGELVGHCFLALSSIREAELTLFVRQEFRRQGVGTELIRRALECAARKNLHRIWALNAAENLAVQGLLERSGFRISQYVLPAIEFDITLLSKI